jgi:gamma-glutamyltranspeptidase/glutathione hydrolase
MLRQPALAKFLRLYRQRGDKAFYSGKVAKDIAETVQATGGVITEKDLSAYKVRWLQPLSVDFQGHRLHLMPPPSSGGIVIGSALKLIDYSALKKLKPQSVEELHLLAEILKISFRGRNLLGDPQFHSNPLAHLISGEYLEPLAKQLSPKKRLKLEPLADVHGSKESTETTHLSVLDIEGNAVAMTVTLNGNYGSGVVSKKYGISLNNEMDDFTTRPGEPNMFGLVQGKANQVEAGKRPLSSMSPTLVEKDGRIVMSLGAPGGPRIISGVIQVLYRTLVNGWNMDIAIQAPRVHHQFLPDQLYFDEFRLQPATQSGLQALGHSLQASSIARVYGIQLNKKGWLEAAFDSRGEGSVDGF